MSDTDEKNTFSYVSDPLMSTAPIKRYAFTIPDTKTGEAVTVNHKIYVSTDPTGKLSRSEPHFIYT